MLIISRDLITSPFTEDGGTNPNSPVIGYHNLLNRVNATADSSMANFPVSNLANPSTILRWESLTTDPQYITLSFDYNEPLDYVAIARHNFGSGNIAASIEISDGVDWLTVVEDTIPANDNPIIFRFEPRTMLAIRMRMIPNDVPPRIAVMYVGKLLVIQRRIYVGHTPLQMGRSATVVNGRSESGDFLGRIVLTESLSNGVELKNLTPDWYRTFMDPFIEASKEVPFFFAWRPFDYRHEVGFAWMTNEPIPVNQRGNGMMQVTLQLGGIKS